MSYDLGVFYTEKPQSDDDAGERYVAFCEKDDLAPFLEPSPRVAAFLAELTGLYPQIDDVPPEEDSGCPWSVAFDVSEGHVLMPMRHSRAAQMIDVIVGLAEKHGLVCFDPQHGKILTAPPGIRVAETVTTKVERAGGGKKRDAPFAALLDELLKARGFARRNRLWRKDGEKAVIALRAWEDDGIYDVSFCAWFKARGKAEPRDVKPGGKHHIYYELNGDFLPPPLMYKLLRAFHFDGDYADDIPRLYGTDETARQIAAYYEPREPLTTEWRVGILREAMKTHVLPWFDRVEAGDEAVISEQVEKELSIPQEAIDQDWRELKSAIGNCRRAADEGADDDALIAALKKQLMFMTSVVVALSVSRGLTIDEARKKVESSGRWSHAWGVDEQESLDDTFEWHKQLVMRPDGRIELLE